MWNIYVNYIVSIFVFLFFFSSRRRHTRCLSDWSSDVCSSDLFGPGLQPAKGLPGRLRDALVRNFSLRVFGRGTAAFNRSEERRVGKGVESLVVGVALKKEEEEKQDER